MVPSRSETESMSMTLVTSKTTKIQSTVATYSDSESDTMAISVTSSTAGRLGRSKDIDIVI